MVYIVVYMVALAIVFPLVYWGAAEMGFALSIEVKLSLSLVLALAVVGAADGKLRRREEKAKGE